MELQSQDSYVGTCFCGSVKISVIGMPRSVVNCHCGQCRRLSGAAFTTWASYRREAVVVTGSAAMAEFKPTSNVRRFFCKTCGTHVYTADSRYPTVFGLPAGTLEGAALPAPNREFFVSHKASWYTLAGEVPRFGGEFGAETIDA